MNGSTITIQGNWIEGPFGTSCLGESSGFQAAYDGFEGDATGIPAGGSYCGFSSDSTRWYFGPNYCNTLTIDDLNVPSDFEGAFSRMIQAAWFWNPPSCEPMLLAVFTAEEFDDTCIAGGYANANDGVVAQLVPNCNVGGALSDDGVLASAFYYHMTLCLESTGLHLKLPEDGRGAMILQLLTCELDTDGRCVAGTLAPATCAQPVLWRRPPHPLDQIYPGGDIKYDDDAPRDGIITLDDCYSYSYGICPDPLALMVADYVGPCANDPQGDQDRDGICGAVESGFGNVGVEISNPATGDTGLATGTAQTGSTITSGDVSISLPAGTSVTDPARPLEITISPGSLPAVKIENVSLPPGTTKTVQMSIGAGSFLNVLDTDEATIEAAQNLQCTPPTENCHCCTGNGFVVDLQRIPNVGDSCLVTCNSSTYTIIRSTLDIVRIEGLQHSAVAMRAFDDTPPFVSCSATPMLWPPNYNLLSVSLSVSAVDTVDPNPTIHVFVFADEDDETPTGDGTRSPDAKDAGPGSLRLRAERKGGGDGRVYVILVTATDTAGNVGSECCTVVVPQSQGKSAFDQVMAQATAAKAQCAGFFASATTGAPPPTGFVIVGDGPVIGPNQ